jgi:hypothetical protein
LPKLPTPFFDVSQVIAGAMTVKCECGWEMVFIQPEEHIVMMNIVFQHLQEVHHVVFPTLCCYWH